MRQDGRPVPLGWPCLPAETSSRLREVRRGLPRRGAARLWLGPSLSTRPGAQRGCPWGGGTHRHGGTPGRREQEAGRWKGLSGRAQRRGNPAAASAAAPLGCPPPLLRPFPSPALPRPLPSAHKTFFFSNFLGGPGRANGRRGSRDKQRRGPWAGQWERRMGQGAGSSPTGQGGAGAVPVGGWGRREGRASPALAAGALGGRKGPVCR